MDYTVLETFAGCSAINEPAALVTVIAGNESSPGRTGAVMTLQSNRTISGTIGGGKIEYKAIDAALACLTTGENREAVLKVKDHRQSDSVCSGGQLPGRL